MNGITNQTSKGLRPGHANACPLPLSLCLLVMKTTIKIFTDATNKKSASVVLEKVKSEIGLGAQSENVEPYHKGGYVCAFEVEVPVSNWGEVPYKLLSLCQSIGRAWQITGSIEEEFDAWSNEASISGVSSVHVQCLHQA